MMSLLDSKYQTRLLKKWGRFIKEGKAIESDQTKMALALVLENTCNDFIRKGMLTEAFDAQETNDGPGAYVGTHAGDKVGAAKPALAHAQKGFAPLGNRGKTDGYMGGAWGERNQNNYGDFQIPNVVMPLLRRIFPELIANELVGVQPLNGPIGFAMALRAQYGRNGRVGMGDLDPRDDGHDGEIGGHFAPDTRYTGWSDALTGDAITTDNRGYGAQLGESAGQWELTSTKTVNEGIEATGAKTKEGDTERAATAADFWKEYAVGYYGDHDKPFSGYGADVEPSTEYASLQDGTYPTVGFNLIKTGVVAKTRKLAAQWSPELAEDMEAMHGIDVEQEMVNILSYEIGAEIDRQIVTEMVKAAITGASVSTWDASKADGLDQMGRLATILTKITVEANRIAVKTRRGNANFVIASPTVTALLEQMTMNKFVSFSGGKAVPSVPYSGAGALQKQGLINDGQQLLVRDAYAKGNFALLGYKGQHPGDSGIIYCPYIPIQLLKLVRPDTGTPQVLSRTRYGMMNSPWDAANYYHFIKIGLDASYTWVDARQFI